MKYVVIAIALALSAFTAYLSILGMTSIFPAVQGNEIYVMTIILEAAKIATALWLHKNWDRITPIMKTYLVVVTVILATITSMGVYSFLMSSHRQQVVAVESGAMKNSKIISVDIKRIESEIRDIEDRIALTTKASEKKIDTSKKIDLVGSEEEAKIRELQTKKKSLTDSLAELEKKSIEEESKAADESSKLGSLTYLVKVFAKEDKNNNELALTIFVLLLVASLDPLALSLLMNAYGQEEPVKRRYVVKTAKARKTKTAKKKPVKKEKVEPKVKAKAKAKKSVKKVAKRGIKTFTIPRQAKALKGRNIPSNTFTLPKRAIVKKRKR